MAKTILLRHPFFLPAGRQVVLCESRMELVYAEVCPFAHRTWLACEETGKPYVKRIVSTEDLRAPAEARPQWWKDTYAAARGRDAASSGKVPILLDNDIMDEESGKALNITESSVCTEYVLAKHLPQLLPTDPVDKARTALFVEQVVPKAIKAWFGLLFAKGDEGLAAAKEGLKDALEALNEAYSDSAKKPGPYFLGEQYSYADIMVWPWLCRFSQVSSHYGYDFPAELAALHACVAAMSKRPAVITTTRPADFYGVTNYANGSK
jgi:glutathione S-transferase